MGNSYIQKLHMIDTFNKVIHVIFVDYKFVGYKDPWTMIFPQHGKIYNLVF